MQRPMAPSPLLLPDEQFPWIRQSPLQQQSTQETQHTQHPPMHIPSSEHSSSPTQNENININKNKAEHALIIIKESFNVLEAKPAKFLSSFGVSISLSR